mmetsp:Transcript_70316/g.164731  ORF Transcript_70316/g.164731 Transcript_70316/m.164731 type:complete len:90 (-) Transcript_70316:2172-2441(-)
MSSPYIRCTLWLLAPVQRPVLVPLANPLKTCETRWLAGGSYSLGLSLTHFDHNGSDVVNISTLLNPARPRLRHEGFGCDAGSLLSAIEL